MVKRNSSSSNITVTQTIVSQIMGEGREYLPSINELPSGFQLMETKGEPGNFTSGNYYQLTYTNTDFLFQQREVNVLYTAIVCDSTSIAEQVFDRLSDSSTYQEPGVWSTTTQESLAIEEFTNVDEVSLFFGQDISELGTQAINYTLVFRFQNFIASFWCKRWTVAH